MPRNINATAAAVTNAAPEDEEGRVKIAEAHQCKQCHGKRRHVGYRGCADDHLRPRQHEPQNAALVEHQPAKREQQHSHEHVI